MSAHCQKTTKVMAEGIPPCFNCPATFNSQHHGSRLRHIDQQTNNNAICGCAALTTQAELHFLFEITGSAIPAPDRAGFDESMHDYVLFYRNGSHLREITVCGSAAPYTAEAVVLMGDYDLGDSCYANYTPDGFALEVQTFDSTMTDSGAWEDIEIRLTGAYYGTNPNDTFPYGWNNVVRFIIEEGDRAP